MYQNDASTLGPPLDPHWGAQILHQVHFGLNPEPPAQTRNPNPLARKQTPERVMILTHLSPKQSTIAALDNPYAVSKYTTAVVEGVSMPLEEVPQEVRAFIDRCSQAHAFHIFPPYISFHFQIKFHMFPST